MGWRDSTRNLWGLRFWHPAIQLAGKFDVFHGANETTHVSKNGLEPKSATDIFDLLNMSNMPRKKNKLKSNGGLPWWKVKSRHKQIQAMGPLLGGSSQL